MSTLELENAVRYGDLATVQRLCEQGFDEPTEDWSDSRNYLLLQAIETTYVMDGGRPKEVVTGHPAIVSYLLDRGANANFIKPNSFGTTALHLAAKYGYPAIAMHLIEAGAVVDAKEEQFGYTPLYEAIYEYKYSDPEPSATKKANLSDTIKVLVDKGADVNARDEGGDTILHRYSRSGSPAPELLTYLISKRADIHAEDNSGTTPLHHAALSGDLTTANLLIQHGADVNAGNSGSTPLDFAQEIDNPSTKNQMMALLQPTKRVAPVAVPENELPPERKLQTAVRSGDLGEVHRLCELGIDEDKSQEWGPDFRSSLLYSAVLTYPDFSSGTPKARATGHTEIVSYLLKRGANPNFIEENDRPAENQTPLHWAARYGYKDIAALLIQHGADVNAKWEVTGDIPLGVAVRSYTQDDPEPDEATKQRIFDTIRLLVDKGADVNTRNNTKEDPDYGGDTILHRIAGGGQLVQFLVDNGADINARDDMGWTPLHKITAFVNGTSTACALIQSGADVNAKSNNGQTPLDLARSEEMKALLQSYQTSETAPTSTPETVAKGGGCMGVLAVVACIAIGFTILFLISRGTTASQSRATTSVQPLYRASLDTSTVSTLPDRGHLTVQNWQGEHFPQTRTNYLQEADIQDWSYSGVRYALNEMYARHGYLFKDSPLRHQFQKFSWYHPVSTITSADIEAQFTPRESANQRLLAARRAVLVQEGKAIK